MAAMRGCPQATHTRVTGNKQQPRLAGDNRECVTFRQEGEALSGSIPTVLSSAGRRARRLEYAS